MVKIKFNNQALKRSAYYQQIDQATITINDQDFQLSRSYAVALSDKFLSKYINNQQYNHFQINVNLESTNAYDLFKSIISNQLSEFDCDEVVLRDIFHIGILLQSDDLKSLYINNVINKLQPEFKNSLKILECYFELECEDEMNEWIDNVASHFYEIDFNEMKQYALKHGFDIMQRILSNPHLRIESEDLLASLIISIAKEKEEFASLVEYIHLEHCTAQTFKEIYNASGENNSINFTKALCDAFVRSRISIYQKKHRNIYMNYFNSGDVKMHVSSTSKGKDEDINSYQDNCIHLSDQQSNQWVSWKIISDKAIQPTEYIVRSAPANANSASLLQSWEVVGTTIEGKKEVLSKVNNSPLSPGEIRTYSLNTDKKYTSFRLTQTDLNADGSNYLLLDVFDFSGYVFDYEDD